MVIAWSGLKLLWGFADVYTAESAGVLATVACGSEPRTLSDQEVVRASPKKGTL